MIHQAMIGGTVDTAEGDGVFIVDDDFKILPRPKVHFLPHGGGQDNLTFL